MSGRSGTDPPGPEHSPADPPGSGSAGQTYLVGAEVYLRPLRADDATRSVAWRESPFPASAKVAEKFLEEEVPKEAEKGVLRLVACRKSDDVPVGAAAIDFREDWPTAYGQLHVAPWPVETAAAVKAEMLGLLVPWLADERGCISVAFDLDDGEPAVVEAAAAAGMRPAFRIREAIWRAGARHDWVAYQKLHPAWLGRLGDPGPGILAGGEPLAAPRSPAPRHWPESRFPLPPNTIVASDRLALRPLETGDAEDAARSTVQETEDSFGEGRTPDSPLLFAKWWGDHGEQETPDEVNFAIVLRETGEVIGDNGLYNIDWIGQTAETGSYIFRPQHRGAGLGTEAKHLLLEYAFERLGLFAIWSWVLTANGRSAAALRKQGYRDAGRVDWVGVGRGEFQSALLFDLLAEEWRAARR
ncbi:MAG: GNAT family N-acetyltransferase [Chloroflexia bacterium]|nr:GNAT family N-acetyltransferase [Chloroflexia bacterium]